jgi:hypothetical protein
MKYSRKVGHTGLVEEVRDLKLSLDSAAVIPAILSECWLRAGR